ncbi:MAG: FAD-dependent oxidoreductase [Anaerolineae bacterium]|jgi:ferredoxin--NADP+ reductase|nr:FAD-dependent oxidoreductase [Anaerolineae bacterium]
MAELGSPEHPLRVAVVGSGPSGFYAAEHLFKQANLSVQVDMFERLPTPFGLVRGGVAPDHPKIKSVTKVYDKTASRAGFRFFGNVEIGRDLTVDELRQYYHAVLFAVGAQTDRALGIPGEDLPGSHAATEFVGWYNGHPDFKHRQFDLSAERAVVIGVGNVAMDVARILSRTCDELISTDIADYALEALDTSRVREVILLGRRGPAQAAFTPAELGEFGEMADADVIVAPEDAAVDPLSAEWLAASGDRDAQKNVALLAQYMNRPPVGKPRRIIIRFLASPVEIVGDGRVEGIRIVKNMLVKRPDGSLAAQATDQTELIPCGLVFRSVGYKGVALPGLPFDERAGVIPNTLGRVADTPGVYVAGWIKRGPSGIIGTNKPDSVETVECILQDYSTGQLESGSSSTTDSIETLLTQRGVLFVTFTDWQKLDQLEMDNGAKFGRPRLKFTAVVDMLAALDKR